MARARLTSLNNLCCTWRHSLPDKYTYCEKLWQCCNYVLVQVPKHCSRKHKRLSLTLTEAICCMADGTLT